MLAATLTMAGCAASALIAMGVTSGIWAASLAVGGAARYACWALAILIYAAPYHLS